MYDAWGLNGNPFETTSLGANRQGSQLLIGRDQVVARFQQHLSAPPRAVTIEGAVGVGKTSLVNVAVYRALESYLQSEAGPLFVPALEPLQVLEGDGLEQFLDKVYVLLARTLIQRAAEIKGLGWALPSTSAINEWLNEPLITRLSGSVGGLGVQRSAERNDGEQYERGAFRAEVQSWLRAVFPRRESGGVVCLVDNLELLRTSDRARRLVEGLRDPMFSIPGVRWVFCGANGITRSVAGSPRLDGYLHDPIDVNALGAGTAREIYDSRMAAFASGDAVPDLPLAREGFVELFTILGSNTRSALKYADTYCMSEVGSYGLTELEKSDRLNRWLLTQSKAVYEACREEVGDRAWRLFEVACSKLPQFAPGDFSEFDFNSSQAMVPHVRSLENSGLLASEVDEEDNRRRTISVTPKGWLARYARSLK